MKKLFFLLLLLLITLIFTAPTSAQEPLNPGENKLGEVSATNAKPTYTFNAAANQTVDIEILGITDGFIPSLTITDGNGQLVQAFGNPTSEKTLTGSATFVAAGVYQFQVTGLNNTVGQFVITVADTQPALPLPENQPQLVSLQAGGTLLYEIAPNPGFARRLRIFAPAEAPPGTAPRARLELHNASGELVGFLGSSLQGGDLLLPPTQEIYHVTLVNDLQQAVPVDFSIVLEVVTPDTAGNPIQTPEPTGNDSAGQPQLPTTGACVLATNGQNVNVRSGDSTNYGVITQISLNNNYPVVGKNADGSWYQIEANGYTGWVSSGVTIRGGDCSNVAITQPNSAQPPIVTEVPTEVISPPTEEATQPPTEETTPPPTEEATEYPAAGNNDVNGAEINIKSDNKTYSGAISYPNGDTSDTVSFRVVGFDSITTSGNVTITITCSGTGLENVTASPTACNTTTTQFFTDVSNNGRVTISLPSGEGSYVNWTVILSANN